MLRHGGSVDITERVIGGQLIWPEEKANFQGKVVPTGQTNRAETVAWGADSVRDSFIDGLV